MALILSAEGVRVEIALDIAAAPRTAQALVDSLPARVDLHCAKIAGDQILWPAPFVMPLESARDIQGVGPGAFIYYPKRQFLEIMFGPLQDETASVTILGQVSAGLDGLARIGKIVQKDHGWRTVWAELRAGSGAWRAELARAAQAAPILPGEVAQTADADAGRSLQAARSARRRAWSGMPREFERLRAREGVMLPLGPIFFAESELRKLHENLWLVRETGSDAEARTAAMLIRGAAAQLDGLLGLHETARTLSLFADALVGEDDRAAVLDEAIMAVGRLSHWLDLYFPWQKLNEASARAALGAAPKTKPAGGTGPRAKPAPGKSRTRPAPPRREPQA